MSLKLHRHRLMFWIDSLCIKFETGKFPGSHLVIFVLNERLCSLLNVLVGLQHEFPTLLNRICELNLIQICTENQDLKLS
jgi:hypothetical protein